MPRPNKTAYTYGNTRCGSTTLSARAFAARKVTWETLAGGNYHRVWHPQYIDYALNRCPNASSIREIVSNRKFLRACQQFSAAGDADFHACKITPELLSNIGHADASKALDAYLAAQANRAMRTLNCGDRSFTAREEISATIRHQYLVQAGTFSIGTPAGDGSYRSFGYAAYHQRFIQKAWNEITKTRSGERY